MRGFVSSRKSDAREVRAPASAVLAGSGRAAPAAEPSLPSRPACRHGGGFGRPALGASPRLRNEAQARRAHGEQPHGERGAEQQRPRRDVRRRDRDVLTGEDRQGPERDLDAQEPEEQQRSPQRGLDVSSGTPPERPGGRPPRRATRRRDGRRRWPRGMAESGGTSSPEREREVRNGQPALGVPHHRADEELKEDQGDGGRRRPPQRGVLERRVPRASRARSRRRSRRSGRRTSGRGRRGRRTPGSAAGRER